MAEVIWTREALSDLAAIRAYIDQFDPDAAARFAERLREAAESLADFPYKGRALENDLRQWSIVRPYRIRYLVDDTTVYIIDIVHGAQLRS
ncbi:MAG: type II toxin-antitoxin system RelE/ParE family toxin [Sphingomonas sp.]|nr:type II toxin-antitoxin system RelE/ParE family toxin [Sphingomonas sp.]